MLRNQEYSEFFARYIALCLLHEHDRSINDIIKKFDVAGMEVLKYLQEIHLFGALDAMTKDGWITKYTKEENGINILYYHLTKEGQFYVGPYRTKLRDFYLRMNQFYNADEHYSQK